MIIEDRAAAIDWAIASAAPADIVLVAGKGHENYQLLGDARRDFSDYGVAAASLLARARGEEDDK
jgi:UDP-N-acetylmuramoyl-L-alanyl-D-glutamate--2,6-diaminopimelate ligase